MLHALSTGFPGGLCFFQPLKPATPTARLTVMPARRCTGRRDGVSTFHVLTLSDNLGGPWTPRKFQDPCRHVSDRQPLPTCKPGETRLQPDNPGRLVARLTTHKDLCLFSPYCPILALNRAGFPEESPPCGFLPIRYIVRRASHPVISATVARLPRIPAGPRWVTTVA
jgi:hypothetical protein